MEWFSVASERINAAIQGVTLLVVFNAAQSTGPFPFVFLGSVLFIEDHVVSLTISLLFSQRLAVVAIFVSTIDRQQVVTATPLTFPSS
jgi:hypothetical protein